MCIKKSIKINIKYVIIVLISMKGINMDQENNNIQTNLGGQPTEGGIAQPMGAESPNSPINNSDGLNTKKSFSKAGIIAIASLCCVFLVAIIACIVIVNAQNNRDADPVSYDDSEDDSTGSDSGRTDSDQKPSTTLEGLPDCSKIEDQSEIDVCKTISGAAEYLVDKYSPDEGQIVLDYNYENYGPIYKTDYLTAATGTISGHKAYQLSSKYRKQETPIRDYLLGNGFEETIITLQDPYANNVDSSLFINPNTGVICSGESVMECANTAWYPAEGSDTALLLNDLANVLASQPDITVTASDILSIGDIKDSEISPYQTVTGSFNNGGVSFYRVGPNSEWLFGYIAQSILSCEYYNNVDMRNAYASEQCQPDGSVTITTVKEYYNL